MADAHVRVTISQPLEEVFAVLTDPETTPKWSAPAVEVPPQWALCFSLWLPSQSAASSWELELGYFEQ